MKFDKKHLVVIESLNEVEAQAFLSFLELERERHIKTAGMCKAWIDLWNSEFKRQLDEVNHIDEGIKRVKEKFRWK